MRYEILLRNRNHDVVILPYAVVSHLGVDVLLSRVCEADEHERGAFFSELATNRRARYLSDRTPFVLAVVVVEKANVPLSLSPEEMFNYEGETDMDLEGFHRDDYLVSTVQSPERI